MPCRTLSENTTCGRAQEEVQVVDQGLVGGGRAGRIGPDQGRLERGRSGGCLQAGRYRRDVDLEGLGVSGVGIGVDPLDLLAADPGAVLEHVVVGREQGDDARPVSACQQVLLAIEHYQMMMSFYGTEFGVRIARKHVGWLIQRLGEQDILNALQMAEWRAGLMKQTDAAKVVEQLEQLALYVQQQGSGQQVECAA